MASTFATSAIETAWVQPVITTSSRWEIDFSVITEGHYYTSVTGIYDNNDSTAVRCDNAIETLYFPNFIKPTAVRFLSIHNVNFGYACLGVTVYGSLDNTNFTEIGNLDCTADSIWHTCTCSTNVFYRYIKLAWKGGAYNEASRYSTYVDGTCLTSTPDYLNSWASPAEQQLCIKY